MHSSNESDMGRHNNRGEGLEASLCLSCSGNIRKTKVVGGESEWGEEEYEVKQSNRDQIMKSNSHSELQPTCLCRFCKSSFTGSWIAHFFLHIAYGCFYTKLSHCNRNCRACPLQNKFASLWCGAALFSWTSAVIEMFFVCAVQPSSH